MKNLLVASLFVSSCASQGPKVGDLLTPDQFHLGYANSQGTSTGALLGSNVPWDFASSSESDVETFSVGFTWNLGGSENEALRELARELQISSRLLAEERLSIPAPEVDNTPVEIEPIPEKDFPQEITYAIAALITAITAWFGRSRIPYVKDWTKTKPEE